MVLRLIKGGFITGCGAAGVCRCCAAPETVGAIGVHHARLGIVRVQAGLARAQVVLLVMTRTT